ncbi:hypothetical protein BGW42_003865 [Actinomortierella wolfii]|nr:hypothetical protein BGW42_003865 [Actinomortierella wolfii]
MLTMLPRILSPVRAVSQRLIRSSTVTLHPRVQRVALQSSASLWIQGAKAFTTTSSVANGVSRGSAAVNDNKVQVKWDDGKSSRFHHFWLRDHCHCPECYHTVTKQRLFNTFQIPRDIQPKSIESTSTGIDIVWTDNHKSHYDHEWLRAHSYDPKILNPFKPEGDAKIPWDISIRDNLPRVEYGEVMETDKGLAKWLNNIHVYGFSMVNNVPVSTEATEKLAQRIAFIRETHYGGFWDFTSDLGHGDTAYTDIALGAHTDNTYFTDPCGLQMFHMLYHDGEGGDNLLVDGLHCAQVLKEKHPESYQTLSTLSVGAHCAGDKGTHIVPTPRRNPILKHDPFTGELAQIRFNNDDRSTVDHLSPKQVEQLYDALFDWNAILTDKKHELWTKFEPGTVIIFDNWRVLHGRSSFTGKRRMCGAYINWDDYRSRWRTLNLSEKQLALNI